MRDIDRMIEGVNDGIVELRQAKAELEARTHDLVATMKTEGRTREWALGYMDLVCKAVDEKTAQWAMAFFEEAWPTDQ